MTLTDGGLVLVAQCEGPANAATLAQCQALAERLGDELGLAGDDALALRLSVDEACTNIVEHGYAGTAGGPLSLQVWATPPGPGRLLRVQLRDRATPFDPRQARQPDLHAEVEDRAIGGLGWYFIHEMMDSVDYRRLPDGHNLLELTRACGGDASTPVPAPDPTP